MSNHSYSSIFYHLVWPTKNRESFIQSGFKKDLYFTIGKICVVKGWNLVAVNGTSDHIHILIQLFPNDKISGVISCIKANSSRFIREHFVPNFCWQSGYAVFSVDANSVERIKNYIARQEEHHAIQTPEDEYLLLLKRNAIKYGDYSRY